MDKTIESILSSIQQPKIGSWPTPERTVKVSLPPSVAYNLDAFQKVQASILGRLGCDACTSGWDIRFDVIREYVIDQRLNVKEVIPAGVVTTEE